MTCSQVGVNLFVTTYVHLGLQFSHLPLSFRAFYFTDYLNQWGGSLLVWSDHLLRTIRSVFEKSSAWNMNLNPFISAVVTRYYRSASKKQHSHQNFASKLCDLLVEVSLHENFRHLVR